MDGQARSFWNGFALSIIWIVQILRKFPSNVCFARCEPTLSFCEDPVGIVTECVGLFLGPPLFLTLCISEVVFSRVQFLLASFSSDLRFAILLLCYRLVCAACVW